MNIFRWKVWHLLTHANPNRLVGFLFYFNTTLLQTENRILTEQLGDTISNQQIPPLCCTGTGSLWAGELLLPPLVPAPESHAHPETSADTTRRRMRRTLSLSGRPDQSPLECRSWDQERKT